jgi:hypothetical protein
MMAAEGWRAGYEKGIDYGLYKRKHASTKDEKRHFDLVYRLHTAQMKFVSVRTSFLAPISLMIGFTGIL